MRLKAPVSAFSMYRPKINVYNQIDSRSKSMVQNTHAHAERGRIVKTDINVAVDDVYSLFLVDATVRVCIFMY